MYTKYIITSLPSQPYPGASLSLHASFYHRHLYIVPHILRSTNRGSRKKLAPYISACACSTQFGLQTRLRTANSEQSKASFLSYQSVLYELGQYNDPKTPSSKTYKVYPKLFSRIF